MNVSKGTKELVSLAFQKSGHKRRGLPNPMSLQASIMYPRFQLNTLMTGQHILLVLAVGWKGANRELGVSSFGL